MALNNLLLSFLLHLGVLLLVTAEESVYSMAGHPVTLPCPDVSSNQDSGTGSWKYEGADILRYTNGRPWKAIQDKTIKGTEMGDYSLQMTEAKEGLYSCDVSGSERRIRLRFLKVTGSPEGDLLQGESIELQLHPSDMMPTPIEWLGPQNEKGHQPRWNLMDNNRRLQIKDLQLQDNGTWKCSAHGQIIPYKVTVIGFLDGSNKKIFAAINNTVTLSFKLNSENENYMNAVGASLMEETLQKPISQRGRGSCSEITIPKVQFEDGGQYQCSLRFSRGWLNRTIDLVVMKVFVNPPGPLPKEGGVTLCCNISGPLPPGAELHWDPVNKSRTFPHCLYIQKAGPQKCSLVIGKEVKISVMYTVEAAPEQSQFRLTGMALGIGMPLVLLILASTCLITYIAIKRKKRRAERMAQAKQHLLAKRTCQCKRDQSNDYYHT